MIVDIIILVLIILAIILGRHKGLTVCLVNFFSLIIALVVALMLYGKVSNYIMEKTEIGNNIKETIKQNIPMSEDEIDLEASSILPEQMRNYINEQVQNANTAKDEAIETVSTQLATEIVNVISFVGIFIIVKLALIIVKVVSRIITKLPVLKQIDHLGGAIVGGIQGIVVVYFIFAIISTMSPVFANTKVLEYINDSYVGKMMYNNNIIMNKIKNL